MPIGGGIVNHNHSGATQGGATLSAHVPPGRISFFGFSAQPASISDWLQCNGQNVSRTTYAALFAAIGITWGAGDGSTTFTLPDFRRRVPVGMNGTGTGVLGNTVGSTGGLETTEAHTHGAGSFFVGGGPNAGGGPNITIADNAGGSSSGVGGTSGSFGTGAAGNFQPSAVCGFWIKT